MIIHTDIARFYTDVIENEEYGYVFKDLVILDVGCNSGMFSWYMAPCAKEIHAVDISRQNLDNYEKTIKDSKLINFKTYHCGIADKTAFGMIERMGKPEGGGWRINTNGTEKIAIYTLDDFLKVNKIPHVDILKLDVEGMEDDIIRDPKFPYEKISTILGEWHYPVDNSNRQLNFEQRFEYMGYRFEWRPNAHFIARR